MALVVVLSSVPKQIIYLRCLLETNSLFGFLLNLECENKVTYSSTVFFSAVCRTKESSLFFSLCEWPLVGELFLKSVLLAERRQSFQVYVLTLHWENRKFDETALELKFYAEMKCGC